MFAKALSILTLLAIFARSAVAADCTRSYTVKEGDYCDQISRDNNVSTFQLVALNVGKFNQLCTDLPVGATLCLGELPEQDCKTTYTVKQSDTCDGVSTAAGTNNTILILNNPQINADCTNIYVGEVLCTAQSVQVPPIPPNGIPTTPSGPPANPPPSSTSPPQTSAPPVSPQAYGGPTTTTNATPTQSIPVDDDQLPYCEDGDV